MGSGCGGHDRGSMSNHFGSLSKFMAGVWQLTFLAMWVPNQSKNGVKPGGYILASRQPIYLTHFFIGPKNRLVQKGSQVSEQLKSNLRATKRTTLRGILHTCATMKRIFECSPLLWYSHCLSTSFVWFETQVLLSWPGNPCLFCAGWGS